MTPRFEFRIFGAGLRRERETLAAMGGIPAGEDARTDTYFAVPGRIEASLKLRDGGLDLKLLRQRSDGLELWEPAGKVALPAAPEALREQFLGPAGIRLDLPESPVDEDLLLSLARAAPPIRVVRVEKRRRRYKVGGVSAEFTRLAVEDRPLETVAVEEADPGRATGAVATLGLSARRNVSYQRFLVETLFAGDCGRDWRSDPS